MFAGVFGPYRGPDLSESPLAVIMRLCAAAAVLGDRRLATFIPRRPIPASSGIAAISAMGARNNGDELVKTCETRIATHPSLDRVRHRAAVAALCDAAYAHIGRPFLTEQQYADNHRPGARTSRRGRRIDGLTCRRGLRCRQLA